MQGTDQELYIPSTREPIMIPPLRPSFRMLSETLAGAIIDEAYEVLQEVGVYVESDAACTVFRDGGCLQRGERRYCIPRDLAERCLASAPRSLMLWDASATTSWTVGGDEVHFDPGSSALWIYDHPSREEREAVTADVVQFHRLIQKLDGFRLQSTGLISSDVPQRSADAYRLYLALRHCSKPVVTGTFVVEGFRTMHEMLCTVRGGAEALRAKPLAVFDACPSPPLRWSALTAQSVIDCARAGIPSEFVAMPLTGATAPVTLSGALVQHVAENLSGLVLAQLAAPGAPVIFGGSPAAFDLRTGTPPMGAIETMMIDCAYAELGKRLGLPTHAYMGLTDAKCIDTQAGIEVGTGTILAALAGINVVSGGGMMDFESCQSLERLVIDNEVCLMAYRLLAGIAQRETPMARTVLEELADSGDFLTHPGTLQWAREEHRFSTLMDREDRHRWTERGKPTLADRAHIKVGQLLSDDPQPLLPAELCRELERIMVSAARHEGLDRLPGAG
jgi:trimethylamine--corrinoid protein Co-methyltransferase